MTRDTRNSRKGSASIKGSAALTVRIRRVDLRVPARQLALPALLAATLLAPVTALQASTPQAPLVGEVSMVLGKAWLRSPDGNKEQIRIGTRIGVADQIETTRNGHVHVRFVDQGLVVVRPSSLLEVERYDYNADNPAASAVKLNLREGVARSISGDAAESAKQNFRLNTPIAAIGVRGTDFVVSTSQDGTRALVKEGAIVLAPFSADCSMAALGPCSSNALELAGDAGQIAVLNAGMLQATLLPRPDTDIPEALLMQRTAQPLLAEQPASAEPEKKEGSTEIYTDSVTTLAVNRKISTGRQLAQGAGTPPVVTPPREFTPDVALTADALTTNTQLVWGRWFERRLPNERMTVSYAQAFRDGREATISSESYALFRFEQGSKEVNIKPGLGVMAFNLNQAQAILNTGSTRELMDVFGGLLNINFDDRRFSTTLQLSHAATGKIEYSDSGLIFDGGVFRNRSDDKVTVGVLSIDGKEAGYSFQTNVAAGAIEGITLWSVKP